MKPYRDAEVDVITAMLEGRVERRGAEGYFLHWFYVDWNQWGWRELGYDWYTAVLMFRALMERVDERA